MSDKRVPRAEREPLTRTESMGLKGLAATLLIGAAGLAGFIRAGEISKIKDRIEYAAKQAKEDRQIALALKEFKCQDTADGNTASFSRSEVKALRKTIPPASDIIKDEAKFFTTGAIYTARTGQSAAWADPFLDTGSGTYTDVYVGALAETVDGTRHLDLDSSIRGGDGRLPIERFRSIYAHNAQEELTEAIDDQNEQTHRRLGPIYDMEEGFIPVPGVDHVLSLGELPSIGQLSDETAKQAGINTHVYDVADSVYGVAFNPVDPACE